MNMLEDLPAGPQLRPERAEADKTVISDAVRGTNLAAPSQVDRSRQLGSVLRRRPLNRRATIISVSTAAVLVLVVALVVALGAGPSVRAPGGAHLRVVSHGPPPGRAPAWKLVSDVSPSWRTLPSSHLEPDGLPGVNFSCPTTTTCYVVNFASAGPGTATELEVTDDDGAAWRPSTLPVTLALPPSLACVDADTCAILGIDGSGDATFLETTDGGRTWSSHAGPNELTSLNGPLQLACKTPLSCLAVASPGAVSPDGPPGHASAFITDDGGSTWSTSSLPAGFMPTSLQCTSAEICVASGNSMSPGETPSTAHGMILYTTDGGSNWLGAALPSVRGVFGPFGPFGPFGSLSCGDTGNCLATGFGVRGSPIEVLSSTDGGKTWAATDTAGLPQGAVMSLSCPAAADCWETGAQYGSGESQVIDLHTAAGFAASTSDSGKTWQEAELPQGVGAVLDISCPNNSSCYALALQRVKATSSAPQQFILLAYGVAT
jgi:photosystem II stability/assembly factor-like uncharacterized protein